MWLSFLAAILACILLLYFPGYLFNKSFNISSLKAIIYAPISSIALICLIGICFSVFGIYANAISLGICIILICLLCFFVGFIVKRQRQAEMPRHYPLKIWMIFLGYLLCGIAATTFMYITPLDGPNSFVQTYDNVFHYNVIESFLQSGSWSILSVDSYLGSADASIDPFPGSSFYPAGWHTIVAFVSSSLSFSVALTTNAVNSVFMGVVFPSGVFLLLLTLFDKHKVILACGIASSMVVAVFPWSLYNQWPLFPNATSLCLVLIVAACFISIISSLVNSKRNILFYGIIFFLGLVAITAVQPNSVFSLIVFLVPYCLWQLFSYGKEKFRTSKHPSACALILPLFFLLAVLTLFIVFYNLPFLQSTIQYYWPPIMTFEDAVINVLNFSFTTDEPQWTLSILVILGIVYIIFRKRNYSWLILSFVLAIVIFVIAATDGDTFLKHFASGYWYTDPYRIAALAGVFAIPIISVGLSSIIEALLAYRVRLNKKKALIYIPSTIIVIALPLATFIPASPISNSMISLQNNAYALNLNIWNYFDSEEVSFIEKAKSFIPDNAVIINQPYDGSMYAYGISGIHLYYRDIAGYGSANESSESKLIREKLDKISVDSEVQAAVKSISASYVLLLKPNYVEEGLYYSTYQPDLWTGINSISENTPGFSLVYEENSMKLYRITEGQ